MYNYPYFIPGYNPSMLNSSMMGPMRGAATNGLLNSARGIGANTLANGARGIGTASTLANGARGAGLFSKLGTGLSGIKAINWGSLINNASKTLGVINQTIPLVRQVGPMVNNMRSMLKIASVFKDETDTPRTNISKPTNTTSTKTISSQNQHQEKEITKKEDYSESPVFFVNT